MNDNTLSTPVSTVRLLSDGIIEVRILPNVIQTMDTAGENIAACIRIGGGKHKPLLLDLQAAEPLAPEIRRYYASREVGGHFSAIAILVHSSPFGRAIGNFYLSVARSGVKKQLFQKESTALSWLRNATRD